MKHLLTINNLTKKEILKIIQQAEYIKKRPKKFSTAMFEKSLLMIFELPSLRTRLSFETAMTQMGGHAINYYTVHSPWGMKKESIEDVGKVISRYVDIVMARIKEHSEIEKLAANSSVPVINGLSKYEHPCQILGDLLTIKEKKKNLKNINLTYIGDACNNVTHSLMYACHKLGIKMNIACPQTKEFLPAKEVINETNTEIYKDPIKAMENTDVVYNDSFISYHIPKSQINRRVKILKPYQVTQKIMHAAKKNAIYMHCLPALRNIEVTPEVIDGKQSVVFDQAENRMHIQKSIILTLLKKDN